jgi:hypothetical protein
VGEDLNEVDRSVVGEETREALELLNELQMRFDAVSLLYVSTFGQR